MALTEFKVIFQAGRSVYINLESTDECQQNFEIKIAPFFPYTARSIIEPVSWVAVEVRNHLGFTS